MLLTQKVVWRVVSCPISKMPGVVFLIVVPTANFERELICGTNHEAPLPLSENARKGKTSGGTLVGGNGSGNNHLNINLPENNSGVLRLEVELRDKNAPKQRRGIGTGVAAARGGRGRSPAPGQMRHGIEASHMTTNNQNSLVPLEKVLEELLVKLDIEHVTWTTSKKGFFHHVVFPLPSGEPCETTLHCLTELGIGTKLHSSVSIIPCSVSYDALTDAANKDDYNDDASNEDLSKWNNFVESIKSKLTVKQVVDGVRAGGCISFDYVLLIVTADSLAALGLVENNAPNITAAMLVSPLMGPVMSITFGAIISDRELMRVGFGTLALGMFISCLFGFIFGLILGTTEMPWGSGDWPTEEMRGRGNARSLWMGVLWALTSGTGVAVALLQGSAGPLIGVAISASLLPPVVNCGLFWALACIWLIYPEKRIPHLKGEEFNTTSAYPFLYTDYLPTEFLINGIVSCLLTVVNVICIFITAIIVLKIKEVSAPYTASPDLKRFWETDLRTVRQSNRQSTMGRRKGTFREKLLPQGMTEERSHELDDVLQQALKEAEDDVTFNKVKGISYSSNAAGELTQRLAKLAGINQREPEFGSTVGLAGSRGVSRMNSIRSSKINVDLKALDKLVNNLLEPESASSSVPSSAENTRKPSIKLNRWRSTSRSAHSFNYGNTSSTYNQKQEHRSSGGGAGNNNNTTSGTMPTIMESSTGGNSNQTTPNVSSEQSPPSWNSSLERAPIAMRNILHGIANAPQRLSQSLSGTAENDEESLHLTQNYLP